MDMTEKPIDPAFGWMECAIQSADGKFFPAMISDDGNGVVRFHIDRRTAFWSPYQAVDYAKYGRGEGRYRSFSHIYRIEAEETQPATP